MLKLTVDVPVELRTILERHPEIPWQRVAEKALWSYARKLQLADQIAAKSILTEAAAETLGRKVKAGLHKHYAKVAR